MERVPNAPERKEFKKAELFELFAPMQRIVEQLHDDIEQGTYTVVLGDDASGRIPALVIDRFLRARYGKLGFPAPETRFVAGSGPATEQVSGEAAGRKGEALRSFVAALGVPEGKRVLIVTDVVVSGKSLEPLMQALAHRGVAFDIAAVGFDEGFGRDVRKLVERGFSARMVTGGSDIYPRIFRRHDLAGVVKKKEDLHAQPYRGSTEHRSFIHYPYWWRSQKRINDVREDVDTLAEALAEAYER
jgi:hypothetical protein